ncbi:MAG: UDP-N-acetylmuramate dehydrogenase [Bdellovibrionota bacterium]
MDTGSVLLKQLSYFQTGGNCHKLYMPASIDEASEVIHEINTLKIPYFILGGGSNSLVWDEDYDGAVISLAKMQFLSIDGSKIHCGAGVSNSDLCQYAYRNSLSGIGWMYRLPGQVGGTVRMNARCYGGEISQVVTKVYCISSSGKKLQREGKHIFRGYKDTLFMSNQDLIVAADFLLDAVDSSKHIYEKMQFCEEDREKKHQFDWPSCGCVFKNDYSVGVPSGMLLEHAGAKELKVGNAIVSLYHSNFIYNQSASSRDILQLSFMMRQKVWEEFGVWLEYEMEILGKLPADLDKLVHEKRTFAPKYERLKPLKEKFKQA